MAKQKKRKCEPIIALGAMTFGGQTNAADSERMTCVFLDEGYTWIDTAHIYTEGRSERILGRILRGRLRPRAFLATKVHPSELGKKTNRFGLRPKRLRKTLELSLKRLRTDYVDLLYLHAPDNATPLETTLEACQQLLEEGKIREIGLSNYASWQVAEAAAICFHNNWQQPLIYQGMYNAITRSVEEECLPACRRFGVDFIAYNPLAGGLLTGKHIGATSAPKKGRFARSFYRIRFWKEECFAAVDHAAAVARRSRISLTDASIRWLLHHSMTDGILLGVSTMDHFEQNLAACRKPPLPPTLHRALDEACDIARPVCPRYFRD